MVASWEDLRKACAPALADLERTRPGVLRLGPAPDGVPSVDPWGHDVSSLWLWDTDGARYLKTNPGLTTDAAEWLAKQDPMLIGADNGPVGVTPDPDPNLSNPSDLTNTTDVLPIWNAPRTYLGGITIDMDWTR